MTAHEFLTDEGSYIHTHIDAGFDDGDPENGPSGEGHDEYDVYEGDSHVIILQRGLWVDQEQIDWDEYRGLALGASFFEDMEECSRSGLNV